jgi:hypothetical protein
MDARNALQMALANTPNIPANQNAINWLQQQIVAQAVSEVFWMQTVTISALPIATSNVAPVTSAAVSLNIQADGAFMIEGAMYMAYNHAAITAATGSNRIIPLVHVLMVDQSGQGLLSDVAVPIPSIFGHDGVPMIWPTPKTIMPKGTLQITPTNYDTAIAYDIYLTFIGKKLLNAGATT